MAIRRAITVPDDQVAAERHGCRPARRLGVDATEPVADDLIAASSDRAGVWIDADDEPLVSEVLDAEPVVADERSSIHFDADLVAPDSHVAFIDSNAAVGVAGDDVARPGFRPSDGGLEGS